MAGKTTKSNLTSEVKNNKTSERRPAGDKTKKIKAKTGGEKLKLVLKIFLLMLWVGVVVIASQLIVGWLMILLMGREEFTKPVATAVFSAVSYILAMVLIIFVPPRISWKWRMGEKGKVENGDKEERPRAMSREEIGLSDWPTWTDIGLAPVGYFVYLILAAGLMFVFTLFPWFNAGEAQEVGFNVYITGGDRLMAFLILVVVAPVAEEIIFRGWLYAKIRTNLSRQISEIIAMIITSLLVSLLFGMIHLQWNVGVNVFALSLVLCALREITGTIYAGILLHILKNGVAFYLLYVLGI